MDVFWYNAVGSLEAKIMKMKIEKKMLEKELQAFEDEENILKQKLNNLNYEENFLSLEFNYLNLTSSQSDEILKMVSVFKLIELNLDQIIDILNNVLKEKENCLKKMKKKFDKKFSEINRDFHCSMNQDNIDDMEKNYQNLKKFTDEYNVNLDILLDIEKWEKENFFTIENEKLQIVELNQKDFLISNEPFQQLDSSPIKENHSSNNQINCQKFLLESKENLSNNNTEVIVLELSESKDTTKVVKKDQDLELVINPSQELKEKEKLTVSPKLSFSTSQRSIEFDNNQNASRSFFNCFSNLTQEEEFSFYNQPNEELTNCSFNFKF